MNGTLFELGYPNLRDEDDPPLVLAVTSWLDKA